MSELWPLWLPPAILLVALAIGILTDARRFGLGILLTVILGWVGMIGVAYAVIAVDNVTSEHLVAWLLLVLFLLVVLSVAVLGVFMIVNAFTMRRKEGLGVSAILSGAIGLAIVAYVTVSMLALLGNLSDAINWLIMIGLPASYVAFLFISYLLYSQLYQWGTRHFGEPVDAVVVLGSGLGGGERVTPLLAGRLERGRTVFDKSVAAGRSPILIVSGGKGSDERISEAQAMSDYLIEDGFAADCVVREDASTDTEENLANSAQVMKAWSASGNVAVATSNYHAFRAAVIMRKAGIPGYTVGCRTARYYWPSATVREFAAILLEHSRINLALIILLCMPLLLGIVDLFVKIW